MDQTDPDGAVAQVELYLDGPIGRARRHASDGYFSASLSGLAEAATRSPRKLTMTARRSPAPRRRSGGRYRGTPHVSFAAADDGRVLTALPRSAARPRTSSPTVTRSFTGPARRATARSGSSSTGATTK
jgi:hypothetical protein